MLGRLVALLGVIVAVRQRGVDAAILSILPGLFLIIGWRCYLKVMHAVPPADFFQPTLHLLSHNVTRLGTISGKAFAETVETSHWSIFWLLTLIAIIYLSVTRRLSRLLLATSIVSPIVLYLLTYVFSAWPSYTAHITSSLPRLFLHVIPAAWLAIGFALSPPKAQSETLQSKLVLPEPAIPFP